MGSGGAAGVAVTVSCGAGDATGALNLAIATASQHPDPAVIGPSGAPQGVVSVSYTTSPCRVYGVRLRSNVRVQVDGGVRFKEYGTGNRAMIGFGLRSPISNASLVLGSTANGPNYKVLVDASQDANNPDVHPIRVHDCSYCAIDGAWFRGNASQTNPTTTSGMVVLNGGNDHVTLSNLTGVQQPATYGLTEINAAQNLAASTLTSYGGVALRLEWATNSTGISGVTASGITGYNCRFALDLSAHASTITGVQASGITSHSCDAGVNATNAAGVNDAGGGTATGSVTGGCIYAGSNAQKTTSLTSWVTVQSEYVTHTTDITDGNAVRVTFDNLGYKGNFTQSTAGGDPTVTC